MILANHKPPFEKKRVFFLGNSAYDPQEIVTQLPAEIKNNSVLKNKYFYENSVHIIICFRGQKTGMTAIMKLGNKHNYVDLFSSFKFSFKSLKRVFRFVMFCTND